MHIVLSLFLLLNGAFAAEPLVASRREFPKPGLFEKCQATLRADLAIDGQWVPVNIDHFQHGIKVKRAEPRNFFPSRKAVIPASKENPRADTVDDIFVMQDRLFLLVEDHQNDTGAADPTLLELHFRIRNALDPWPYPILGNFAFLVGVPTSAIIYHREGLPSMGAEGLLFSASVASVSMGAYLWGGFFLKAIQASKERVVFDHATVMNDDATKMEVLRDPQTGFVNDIELQPSGNEPYLLSVRLSAERAAQINTSP